MFVCPQSSYVERLTLKVMVLGGGVLERWWGHKGRALVNGVSALIKENPELSPPFHHSEKTPSLNQEVGFHQTLNLLCLRNLGFLGSRTMRNKFLLFMSYLVCYSNLNRSLCFNIPPLHSHVRYHHRKILELSLQLVSFQAPSILLSLCLQQLPVISYFCLHLPFTSSLFSLLFQPICLAQSSFKVCLLFGPSSPQTPIFLLHASWTESKLLDTAWRSSRTLSPTFRLIPAILLGLMWPASHSSTLRGFFHFVFLLLPSPLLAILLIFPDSSKLIW